MRKGDIMIKKGLGRLRKMSRYISQNYGSGSILERASYKKNKIRPYKRNDSIIEKKFYKKENMSLWQRIKQKIGMK